MNKIIEGCDDDPESTRFKQVVVQSIYSLEYSSRHHFNLWNNLSSLFLMGLNRIDWCLVEDTESRCANSRKCKTTITANDNFAYDDYALAA